MAFLLSCALLLSMAACGQDNIVEPTPEVEPPAVEDDGVAVEKPTVADPTETYTVEEISSEELYDKTGVYFFAPENLKGVSYRIIGDGELTEPIAEMSFVITNSVEQEITISYRVHKNGMINADQAAILFGSKEFTYRGSMNISNSIATLEYNDGGETLAYWYSTDAGRNCCAYFSEGADNETLFIYTNLLYAFVHSDMKPE